MDLIIFFETLFLIYLILTGWLASVFLRKKKNVLSLFFIAAAFLLIYCAVIEPSWIKIRRQDINLNKLNSEIKVALISDWHIRPGKGAGFIQRMTKKIAEEKPDLIVMTGDFLYYDDFERFKNDLAALGAISKIAPTYAVLGNHDHGIGEPDYSDIFPDQHQQITQTLSQNNIQVLSDAKERIKIKNEDVWLIGFEEYWDWQNKKPKQAVAGLSPYGGNEKWLKIGLSHNPDVIYEPEAKMLDLILCGHTHGGQIRLPFFGALGEADTAFPHKDYGGYLPDSRPHLFNTVGIGESGPPLRFFNRPEIVILKIK